ncbi:Peptidase S9 prolyl oligopeptidase catalytic domain [Trinorchestia longiramus]|nr:Peptidase S9 prolyl oligopeptidase catalytic domain [Trinorchestia longiramus]
MIHLSTSAQIFTCESSHRRLPREIFEELVASTPDQRNWRGVLIALLVIGLVIGLIVCSVILLSPPDLGPNFTGERFTLQDIVSNKFKPPQLDAHWISPNDVAYRDEDNGVSVLDVDNFTVTKLISHLTFRRLTVHEFQVSPDKKYVLLRHDGYKSHNHIHLAKYTAMEAGTEYSAQDLVQVFCPGPGPNILHRTWFKHSVQALVQVFCPGPGPNILPRTWSRYSAQDLVQVFCPGPGPGILPRTWSRHVESISPSPPEDSHPFLQHVSWVGPSTSLLLVYKNNLYFKRSPTSPVVIRLTSSGDDSADSSVYNGITDYLYYKYVLKSRSALWVNVDGSMLCYAQFNDTGVSSVPIMSYRGDDMSLIHLRYPLVDAPNPIVTLFIVDLRKANGSNPPESMELKPPKRIQMQEHYLTDVKWVDVTTVSAVWRNRHQNVSVTGICAPPLWYCEELTVEESDAQRWVLGREAPIFYTNASFYVTLSPLVDAESGSYPHLHQGMRSSKHKTPLTHGPYTVFRVLAWDVDRHFVYYEANQADELAERHLWRVTDMQSPVPRVQECLTCDLNSSTRLCRHYTPVFHPHNIELVMLYCEGPSVPHTLLYSLMDEEVTYTVQNNSHLDHLSKSMAWPQIRDFRVQLDNGFVATVRMTIPPEIVEEESVLGHTTIVRVTGITGEQIVNYKWGATLDTYFVSNRSWVGLQMDVRGAGGQELAEYYQPAWSLGTPEAHDYAALIKYLGDTLDLVDADRIGAWGWGGHAGYNTLRLLQEDEEGILKCVAAIGPVTDWASYVSYYTEQYMGTARVVERGNYRGYEETSLLLQSELYRNRTLFIAHGSEDLDAHHSHTLKFTKELSRKGVLFREQTYTDEGSELTNVRDHLLRTLDRYFFECFPPYTEEQLDELLEQTES